MEVTGQLYVPADLSPGKESLVPVVWEAGWAPELLWTRWWNNSLLIFPDEPPNYHVVCHIQNKLLKSIILSDTR